jgi:signal transduction histidine kinase
MLIDDLFVSVRPLADEHHVELTRHHEGQEHRVTTDPRRVRQIVLNLLSNAIKFGQGKPVQVGTAPTPDGGVEITVRDDGIGIAPEHLARIFEEFVQLASGDEKGTGLGLPISRRLTELLGGTLTVESALGKGSTFCLVLPPAVKELREEPAPTPQPAADRRKSGETRARAGEGQEVADRALGNSIPESRVV